MDDAQLADRVAIHDLSDGYADAADRRDPVAFADLFLSDATLTVVRDGTEPSVHVGRDQIARIPQMLERYPLTLHVVTNHHCTIDGDEARGGAICQAHHLVTDADGATTDLVLNIRYHDTYARRGAEWRIARTRAVHILWTSTGPVTTSSPSDPLDRPRPTPTDPHARPRQPGAHPWPTPAPTSTRSTSRSNPAGPAASSAWPTAAAGCTCDGAPTCGHIGCCDSSPARHGSAHAASTGHPIAQSYEPGEDWLWCFVDEVAFEIPELTPGASHPAGWSPGPPAGA